jgi:hypothetical protein
LLHGSGGSISGGSSLSSRSLRLLHLFGQRQLVPLRMTSRSACLVALLCMGVGLCLCLCLACPVDLPHHLRGLLDRALGRQSSCVVVALFGYIGQAPCQSFGCIFLGITLGPNIVELLESGTESSGVLVQLIDAR